jgi:hypothetical protein
MVKLLEFLPSHLYASAGHKPLAATQAEVFHDKEEVQPHEDKYGTGFVTPTPLICVV